MNESLVRHIASKSEEGLWFTSTDFLPISLLMKFLPKLIIDSQSQQKAYDQGLMMIFSLNQYSNDHRYINLSQMI